MNLGKIIEIKQETPDVKTFSIELDLNFIPGQYCLIALQENDEQRPFTFTNSNPIALTVKELDGFTNKMFSLKVGDPIWISNPMGETLNFDGSVKEDVVFIAGGSGITPFIAAIRYAIRKNLPNKMTLLFSNRKEEDIIYRKELDAMPDNIMVINTLTDEDWQRETGRINKEMIEKYVDDIENKLWYVCGPPTMVKAMKKILVELGIIEKNIRIEDWQINGKHHGMP